MIGLLKGTVEYKKDSSLIVDVQGVGYKVAVPVSVSSRLQETDPVKLYIHTHVREDLLELYGFTDASDLKLFEYLISVSGVGCKTALTVFSVGSRREIMGAITGNDVAFFTSVPRLGTKNAQKIIIELKNKLGGGEDLDLSGGDSDHSELTAALKTFGFTAKESQDAIRALRGAGTTMEEKIRLALKYLGK